MRTVAGGATTEFVFNSNGQRVSEWNATTHAQLKGHYYWGRKPLAYYASSNAHFEHQDWLGTERTRTSYNGGVEGAFTSLPFGDGQSSTGTDGDAYHYAALDHDAESFTDHAQFRQYSNAQGRWLSPDPYGGSYDEINPQSMNRYAYAQNTPAGAVDPSGLEIVSGCGNNPTCKNHADNSFWSSCCGSLGVNDVTYCGNLCSLVGQGVSGDDGGEFTLVATADGLTWINDLNGEELDDAGAEEIGLPLLGVEGVSTPSSGTTSCTGWATVRGVGGNQAQSAGALHSDYPAVAGGSIQGGTFGTVAVQIGFLGLTTRQLRTYGTQITITPFSNSIVTQLNGPAGPWTVSDYGDANIQATQGVAFDLYRFPTIKAGNQFGKWSMHVTISFPTSSGGSCPAGFTVAQ